MDDELLNGLTVTPIRDQRGALYLVLGGAKAEYVVAVEGNRIQPLEDFRADLSSAKTNFEIRAQRTDESLVALEAIEPKPEVPIGMMMAEG